MIPITRKENYLNEIVGWGETAPEKPLTPEEFFFAAILGEAVQTPEPLTRYQKYLAKIAGRNISVPKPLTRLELFLAKACGMDIETPTPITREEIFWSNYSAIVDFEVEGVPPLSFKAKKAGTLENYRIYGNTVGGESVGDRTGNLFDGNTIPAFTSGSEPHIFTEYSDATAIIVETTLLPSTVTINAVNGNRCYVAYYNTYPSKGDVAELFIAVSQTLPRNITVNKSYKYIMIQVGFRVTVSNIMLNEGSTALPYEPYGYKVPVTVSNGTDTLTTPIYLPEQIRKVGDEAEYIDYGQQKQHFADGTETDVTLPALPTLPGTNVLSVGTAVQPSRVEVKGRIKAVGQETEPEQEAAEAEQEAAEPEQEEPEVKEDDTDDR